MYLRKEEGGREGRVRWKRGDRREGGERRRVRWGKEKEIGREEGDRARLRETWIQGLVRSEHSKKIR